MNVQRYIRAGKGFGLGTIGGFVVAIIVYIVVGASSFMFGCSSTSGNTESTEGEKSAVNIKMLKVEGACDAKIEITVETPWSDIPISGQVTTTLVDNKHTVGAAILNVLGKLSESICEVDTRKKPAWTCTAHVLGRDIIPKSSQPAPVSEAKDAN